MIVIKSKRKKIKKNKNIDGSSRGKQGVSRGLGHLLCDSPLKKNTKRYGCKSNPAKPISGRQRMAG